MTHFAPDAIGLLAPIQKWLMDPQVSEILLNKPGEIYVERLGMMKRYYIEDFNCRTLSVLFRLIANESRQTMGEQLPLLSANLCNGLRIQCVMPPTAKHYCFAIRKPSIQQMSLDQYQQQHFFDEVQVYSSDDGLTQAEQELQALYHQRQWLAFIKKAIALKKNIVISGGTSTGKTTFLNACLREIPLQERLILLEDTREMLLVHENHVSLMVSKGRQGLSDVTMQDLVQCCLRLRPDRIIMGEVRGKEMMDFLSACSTGHQGSFTSIHANSPKMAFQRMVQMMKQNAIPAMSDHEILQEIQSVVDVVVQLNRSPKGRFVSGFYYNPVK